jgi:hypothetical protein
MTEHGVTKIREKFMDEGSLFGLRFRQGYIFLEVTGWEQVKYEPFNNIGAVDSQSPTGFDRLDDSNGDDILFVEKGQENVIHAGIGMSPGYIRRYTNYPEGQNRLRTMPNLGIPTAGDNYGYIDGTDSPYENPTDAEELMIPPGVHLDFNFYNPDSRQREPVLDILTRVYDVRVLNPDNSKDSNMISRIVSPGSPMPVHPVGSTRNQKRYDLMDSWGVRPISREEAKGGS